MPVVEVNELGQPGLAEARVVVRAGVSPLAKRGLDEALGLLWSMPSLNDGKHKLFSTARQYLRDVLSKLPTLTNQQIKDVTPEAYARRLREHHRTALRRAS